MPLCLKGRHVKQQTDLSEPYRRSKRTSTGHQATETRKYKPTRPFRLHLPLETILRVIWTLHHCVANMSTKMLQRRGTQVNQAGIGILLLPCLGFYQNSNNSQNEQQTNRENGSQHEIVSICSSCIAGKIHFVVAIHDASLY